MYVDGKTEEDEVMETKIEVERCYTKKHEGQGGRSTDGRSARQNNMENENSMHRPQIGKRLKKKRCEVYVFMNN